MEINELIPTWGEFGKCYAQLVESNEINAIRGMRSEVAKAMAAAQALTVIHESLTSEQMSIVEKTISKELLKQGL